MVVNMVAHRCLQVCVTAGVDDSLLQYHQLLHGNGYYKLHGNGYYELQGNDYYELQGNDYYELHGNDYYELHGNVHFVNTLCIRVDQALVIHPLTATITMPLPLCTGVKQRVGKAYSSLNTVPPHAPRVMGTHMQTGPPGGSLRDPMEDIPSSLMVFPHGRTSSRIVLTSSTGDMDVFCVEHARYKEVFDFLCVHTHTHSNAYTRTPIHTHPYIYTPIHSYTHTFVHPYIHTPIHSYTPPTHTPIPTPPHPHPQVCRPGTVMATQGLQCDWCWYRSTYIPC